MAVGLGIGRTSLGDRAEDDAPARTGAGSVAGAVLAGLVAGGAGAAVMAVSERVEQRLTGRPPSFMPAHTLQALTGRAVRDSTGDNLLMHYGQGAAVGVARALMGRWGLRGLAAWPVFAGLRLGADQSLENGTGVGAPPWTWSRQDLAVDLLHKAVYALATGFLADRLVARRPAATAR